MGRRDTHRGPSSTIVSAQPRLHQNAAEIQAYVLWDCAADPSFGERHLEVNCCGLSWR